MIHARSPYIVHVDDSGLVDIEFKLYIYTGTKDTDKGTPDYTFAIDAISAEVTFDISPYIRDFLRTIVPNNVSAYVWVTTEIAKDTGAGLGAFGTYEATQLACYGYTEPEDGVNYTTYTGRDLETQAGGFNFSGMISSAAAFTTDVPATAWDDGGTYNWICRKQGTEMQVPIFIDDSGTSANVVRFYRTLGGFLTPGNDAAEIASPVSPRQTITSADNAESNDNMAYVVIPSVARSFTIFIGSIDTMTVNIHDIVGDCEDISRIFFLNKFGVAEEIHFSGRMSEEYSTQSKSFKRSILSSGTYSKWKHQKTILSKDATKRVTINSGHYPEGYNEQFKQLLMSEFVWLLPKGISIGADNFVPVNILDSNLSYKYRRFDKLINYELTLEMSHDAINNIK